MNKKKFTNFKQKGRFWKINSDRTFANNELVSFTFYYPYKDMNEWKQSFVFCDAWDNDAESVRKLKQKDEIIVEGVIVNHQYEDKQGNKKSIVKIQGATIELVKSSQPTPAPSQDSSDVDLEDLPF